MLSADSAIIFSSDDLLHKPLKLLALMQGTRFQLSMVTLGNVRPSSAVCHILEGPFKPLGGFFPGFVA